MLENSGLFFCRADCLGDPFEGSIPRANERLQAEMARDSEAEVLKLETLRDWRRQERKRMFISCWHMNENESAASGGVIVESCV